jgi:hypothetical protein
LRSSIVSETVARSVSSTCAFASTFDGLGQRADLQDGSVRTTWLVATSTPVVLNGLKPVIVTEIS